MSWSYPTQETATEKGTFDPAKFIALAPRSPEAKKELAVPDFDVVWEPIKGSSQELAITSPAHHTLYCGARGPGKTITQIMRFRSRVGIGYGSYWRGIIFDREFKNLQDMIAQSKRFFPQFEDGCIWHNAATAYKWTLSLIHISEPTRPY